MSTFRRNPAAARELAQDDTFQAGLAKIAADAAEQVKAAAPTGGTGYYRRHVRAHGTQIQLSDPFWHLVEFGSIHNIPYAPLRRGMHAAGLRLDLSRP